MYQFKYKGLTYQITDKWLSEEEDYSEGLYDMREFQLLQFNYFIEQQDWQGLENRMFLQLQNNLITRI